MLLETGVAAVTFVDDRRDLVNEPAGPTNGDLGLFGNGSSRLTINHLSAGLPEDQGAGGQIVEAPDALRDRKLATPRSNLPLLVNVASGHPETQVVT